MSDGPELDDMPDAELKDRQLAAAQRFASDPEFCARVTALADWAQRVDVLRGVASGDRTLQYRMAIGLALDTEWNESDAEVETDDEGSRIDWDSSSQSVRTDGDRVAWRNDSHQPGQWFVIDEDGWVDESEVAAWEVLS